MEELVSKFKLLGQMIESYRQGKLILGTSKVEHYKDIVRILTEYLYGTEIVPEGSLRVDFPEENSEHLESSLLDFADMLINSYRVDLGLTSEFIAKHDKDDVEIVIRRFTGITDCILIFVGNGKGYKILGSANINMYFVNNLREILTARGVIGKVNFEELISQIVKGLTERK